MLHNHASVALVSATDTCSLSCHIMADGEGGGTLCNKVGVGRQKDVCVEVARKLSIMANINVTFHVYICK
mgnify:CR=1 FL=1